MRKFMKTCYKCGTVVKPAESIKEGVKLNCLRCPRCKEEYFTSSELIKHDVLTGKRKMARKFGVLGDSTIMRIPPKVIHDFGIRQGDYGVFEKRPEGILVRLVHTKGIKG